MSVGSKTYRVQKLKLKTKCTNTAAKNMDKFVISTKRRESYKSETQKTEAIKEKVTVLAAFLQRHKWWFRLPPIPFIPHLLPSLTHKEHLFLRNSHSMGGKILPMEATDLVKHQVTQARRLLEGPDHLLFHV
jgi:hypothetical protein